MPDLAVDQLRGVQGLVTFESPDLGSALSVAEETARLLVDEAHWGSDIYVAAPAGSRWTADELNEQLLYQQSYYPQGDVRVVILAYAHLMDIRLHDHLLKIVEEPPAPVLFAFVVPTGDQLPVTLQSRIYRRISVPARSLDELSAAIQAAGGAAPSSGLVKLSQASPMLSAGLSGDAASKALPLGESFVRSMAGSGFTEAFRAHKTLKELSRAVSGAGAEAPATKAARREILRGSLQLLIGAQIGSMEHGSTAEALAAEARTHRIEKAQRLAETHLPADQVIAYALTGGSDAAAAGR